MKTLIRRAKRILAHELHSLRHRYLDNFIFIHINKTGGSSIEKALNIPFAHRTALEKIEKIGRQQWENKYTFTIVRNPWDKVVSHYHYCLQKDKTVIGVRISTIGFADWVKLFYGNKDSLHGKAPTRMFMPQSNWITDHDGQILVNFICRFENLNDDFNYVCGKLGKTAILPHVKPSNHGNYRDYYDEETIEMVACWFSKDIENFGYRW